MIERIAHIPTPEPPQPGQIPPTPNTPPDIPRPIDDPQPPVSPPEKERTLRFAKRDQFAPELAHFSACILKDREPEPSGEEGLADVRVIEALYKSAKRNRPVRLAPQPLRRQPTMRQELTRPPVRRRPLVHATPPSG